MSADGKVVLTITAERDVYVVETSRGSTEAFDRRAIDILERLGLIRHVRDGHVLQDGSGRGVGPLHRFYGPADA